MVVTEMPTKEYKCICHYEHGRASTDHASMAEAVYAMRSAIIDVARKPIFIEVVVVTTERVAYHMPLK